jgi:hypothetical protein
MNNIRLNIWASRFGTSCLASGYSLHHLRAFHALRWFRYYPSRNARAERVRVSPLRGSRIKYARIKYLILATKGERSEPIRAAKPRKARGIAAEPRRTKRTRGAQEGVMERIARRKRGRSPREAARPLHLFYICLINLNIKLRQS